MPVNSIFFIPRVFNKEFIMQQLKRAYYQDPVVDTDRMFEQLAESLFMAYRPVRRESYDYEDDWDMPSLRMRYLVEDYDELFGDEEEEQI